MNLSYASLLILTQDIDWLYTFFKAFIIASERLDSVRSSYSMFSETASFPFLKVNQHQVNLLIPAGSLLYDLLYTENIVRTGLFGFKPWLFFLVPTIFSFYQISQNIFLRGSDDTFLCNVCYYPFFFMRLTDTCGMGYRSIH